MDMLQRDDLPAEKRLRGLLLNGSLAGSVATDLSDVLKALDIARGESDALRMECRRQKHNAQIVERRLESARRKRRRNSADTVVTWVVFFTVVLMAAVMANAVWKIICEFLSIY